MIENSDDRGPQRLAAVDADEDRVSGVQAPITQPSQQPTLHQTQPPASHQLPIPAPRHLRRRGDGIEVATMDISRRESDCRTTQFPVGSYVIARPATVSKSITGFVVATFEPYTLTVSAYGVERAVR